MVEKLTQWQRLKALVLDSVSSPITKRVYNTALDEFVARFHQEPRPGFTKATVSAWRVSLEARGLGSSSIIIWMSSIRKLAVEAADNVCLKHHFIFVASLLKYARADFEPRAGWMREERPGGQRPIRVCRHCEHTWLDELVDFSHCCPGIYIEPAALIALLGAAGDQQDVATVNETRSLVQTDYPVLNPFLLLVARRHSRLSQHGRRI